MADDVAEAEKTELVLSENSFLQPTETSGKEAWIRLITNLLFIMPGTYPSDPKLGIGLQQYDFHFIEDLEDELPDVIEDQIRTYLPDVPLESVEINTAESSSGTVLIIVITFSVEEGYEVATVAAESSGRTIDFEVSF